MSNEIYKTIEKYNKIVLINDVMYVGDSLIFFWPILNFIDHCFSTREIEVYHHHLYVFKPINEKISSNNLESFYCRDFELSQTIMIAFTPKRGRLKKYLQGKGFQCIIKDFVGLDFTTINIKKLNTRSDELKCKVKKNLEHHYISKIGGIHSISGFPMLKEYFSNVYEYAKKCNDEFFEYGFFDVAKEGNIILQNLNLKDCINDLLISPVFDIDRNFVLINLICGTFKRDVLDNYVFLLRWIERISIEFKNSNIFILCDDNFPTIRLNLSDSIKNIFFLKQDSMPYWSALIKMAQVVYSIDTGFLHISYVLNKNTYGFGGDVDFWFFKEKIVKLEDSKT